MDIEKLKLVLELVRGVSGDAQQVAIFWICVDMLLPIVCWMAVFFTIVLKLPTFIECFNDSSKFIKWVRGQYSIGCGGYLNGEERAAVEDKLKNLVIADKAKT